MTSPAHMKRIGDLARIVGGGTPSKKNPSYWRGSIPWVSPKDMKRWEIHDAIDHELSGLDPAAIPTSPGHGAGPAATAASVAAAETAGA